MDKLSNELYSQRKKELEEFIDNQRMIDDKLSFIQEEKQKLSSQINKDFEKRKKI